MPKVTLPPVTRVAHFFHSLIADALSDDERKEVDRLNREVYEASVCATHDFCDANMIMDEAFRLCGIAEMDPEDFDQNRLWADAWDLAKREGFASDWTLGMGEVSQ